MGLGRKPVQRRPKPKAKNIIAPWIVEKARLSRLGDRELLREVTVLRGPNKPFIQACKYSMEARRMLQAEKAAKQRFARGGKLTASERAELINSAATSFQTKLLIDEIFKKSP